MASEATVYIMLEDVNDEIPLFTEREQETVLEGEPVGTKVTQVNAIDKDGTFPNNQVNQEMFDRPLLLLVQIYDNLCDVFEVFLRRVVTFHLNRTLCIYSQCYYILMRF